MVFVHDQMDVLPCNQLHQCSPSLFIPIVNRIYNMYIINKTHMLFVIFDLDTEDIMSKRKFCANINTKLLAI